LPTIFSDTPDSRKGSPKVNFPSRQWFSTTTVPGYGPEGINSLEQSGVAASMGQFRSWMGTKGEGKGSTHVVGSSIFTIGTRAKGTSIVWIPSSERKYSAK
jgi:hypothetical protein